MMTILIAGGGLSGLSLAAQLAARPGLSSPVVIVDDGRRSIAEAGWASWANQACLLDEAVSRFFAWFHVHAAGRSRVVGLGSYRYCFVRGDDFAAAATRLISAHGGFTFHSGHVSEIRQAGVGAEVVVDGETMYADWVFDSVLGPEPPARADAWLVFRGWHVRTPTPAFDPATPTFFDFRTAQHGGACFVYVLPRGPQEALVEHTSFAPAATRGRADADAQRTALRQYLSSVLAIPDYTVVREEAASLPLTTSAVDRRRGSVLVIGTKAGMIKPSTGYAYARIQADSSAIARSLALHGHPFDLPVPRPRHQLFDSALLDVVSRDPAQLERIFATLFNRASAEPVLRFLDEATSAGQEGLMFAGLPPSLYLAVMRRPR